MAKGELRDALSITKFLEVISEERGDGCRIAIIDSGIAEGMDVEDAVNLTDESIIDTEEHGSVIQHIIHSILPEAEIYFVKVPDPIPDHILISALKEAMRWRPHAINLSITSEIPSDGSDPVSLYTDHVSKTSVVAVAAGNGGPRFMTIGSPAVAREALTVGATDVKGRLWVKSSRGPTLDGRWKPNVVAPTNFVIPELGEETWPGTSFSTPIATCLAAILMRDVGDSFVARRAIEFSATSIPIIFTGRRITLPRFRKASLIRKLLETWPRLMDSRNLIGMGLLNASEAVKVVRRLREIKTVEAT